MSFNAIDSDSRGIILPILLVVGLVFLGGTGYLMMSKSSGAGADDSSGIRVLKNLVQGTAEPVRQTTTNSENTNVVYTPAPTPSPSAATQAKSAIEFISQNKNTTPKYSPTSTNTTSSTQQASSPTSQSTGTISTPSPSPAMLFEKSGYRYNAFGVLERVY
jgi:hypothetical protein